MLSARRASSGRALSPYFRARMNNTASKFPASQTRVQIIGITTSTILLLLSSLCMHLFLLIFAHIFIMAQNETNSEKTEECTIVQKK
mmetsp:Transcript_16681/g.37373  ORF Transcript_16681/g.37373 Transcript_16681/m.37373 type:complete len:87 (-) Transcript_16681:224-484(-)